MSGLINKETNLSVLNHIEGIESSSKQKDSLVLLEMMKQITGHEPKIWGSNFIIGFGKYTYTRKHGKEEFEWFHVGFAPRKSKISIYLTFDISQQKELLSNLGKCKYGKGCLYINKLADIDLEVLKKLITLSKEARWHS